MKKKKEFSREEIVARLKWFHGEEFDKYPLVDNFKKIIDEDN